MDVANKNAIYNWVFSLMNASAFAGNSRGSQSDLFNGVYIDIEAQATFSHDI